MPMKTFNFFFKKNTIPILLLIPLTALAQNDNNASFILGDPPAIYNEQTILIEDLNEYLTLMYREPIRQFPSKEIAEEVVFAYLIQDVFAEKAREKGFDSDKSYQAKIKATQNLLLSELYINDFINNIKITDTELHEAYKIRIENNNKNIEYLISHIIIETEEKSIEIFTDLKNNKLSFSDAAKRYSTDISSAAKNGDLGWLKGITLETKIQDIIALMQQEEISPPIQTDYGFQIIQLKGTRTPELEPFENLTEQLKNDVINEKVKALFIETKNTLHHLELKYFQ